MKTELAKPEARAAPVPGVRAAAGRTQAARAARRYLPAYLFILPSFAAFIIFTAYPLVDTLVFSLQDLRGGARIWVGLENYRAMLHDEVFLASARNTVLYFLAMVPGGVLLAVLLFKFAPETLWLLPGLWQVLVSLGVFASVRSLPRTVAFAGAWYFIAGFAVLLISSHGHELSPWTMGLPFVIGQAMMAAIIYFADGVTDAEG